MENENFAVRKEAGLFGFSETGETSVHNRFVDICSAFLRSERKPDSVGQKPKRTEAWRQFYVSYITTSIVG